MPAGRSPPVVPTKMASGLYEAWLEVEGKPMEVYGITTSRDGRTMTGYVASNHGEEFTIHSSLPGQESFQVIPFGDGERWGGGKNLEGYQGQQRHFVDFPWLRVSEFERRVFTFKNIKYTDDESNVARLNRRALEELGKVSVRILRIESFGPPQEVQHNKRGNHAGPSRSGERVMHEKVKTMLPHQAGLGRIISIPERRGRNQERPPEIRKRPKLRDQPDRPFMNFEFKYLSRELLEIKGIMRSEDSGYDSGEVLKLDGDTPPPDVKPAPKRQRPRSVSVSTKKMREQIKGKARAVQSDEDDDDEVLVLDTSEAERVEQKLRVKQEEKRRKIEVVTISDDSDSD